MQTAIIYVRKHANDRSSHWIVKPIASVRIGVTKILFIEIKRRLTRQSKSLIIKQKLQGLSVSLQAPCSRINAHWNFL